MKILLAHNHYLIPGGEDESFRAEADLLRQNGHDVTLYEEDNRKVENLGKFRTAVRTLWSAETYRRVSDILKSGSYDLVSVQNFFPLISPSIYYAARKAGVPVIQTLRNYRLICLNGYFFRDGRPCELCLERRSALPGIRYRCYRQDRAGSLVVAGMQSMHRLIGTWNKRVDAYIALTDFSAAKFIQAGLPAAKIHLRPNFLPDDPGVGAVNRDAALFIGRDSPEKGLNILLQAWTQVKTKSRLVVLGPAARVDGHDPNGIEWRGHQPNEVVLAALKQAKFLVFPSLWYENFPRVILEAMACGTPVIASRLGSMPEIIKDNVTGLLFEPGNSTDLADKMNWLMTHGTERRKMGAAARLEYELHYTSSAAYQKLMEIYASIRK
jgi:glycosyltransferase involved in cell wall biosynthesis